MTLPPDIIAVSGPNFKRGRLLLSGDSAIISRGTPFRASFPLTKGTESAMLRGYRQVGAKGLDFPNGICYALGGWTRRRGVFRCHGGRPDAD